MARFRHKKKQMFVIYQAWCDHNQIDPELAFGYKVYAYTANEESAKRLCTESGFVTRKEYGWACDETLPVKYYEALKEGY